MAAGECRVCGSRDSTLLHNVPHLGVFAALCTACVLRLNPGSFCAVCFDVYDENTAHSRTMCVRCPALAHLTCLPSARYLCPQCSDPSFSFFDTASTVSLTKKLICAAKIAAASMHRAAAVARADADQKVMTAVLAKRNAKEAIERLANLTDPVLKN